MCCITSQEVSPGAKHLLAWSWFDVLKHKNKLNFKVDGRIRRDLFFPMLFPQKWLESNQSSPYIHLLNLTSFFPLSGLFYTKSDICTNQVFRLCFYFTLSGLPSIFQLKGPVPLIKISNQMGVLAGQRWPFKYQNTVRGQRSVADVMGLLSRTEVWMKHNLLMAEKCCCTHNSPL